MLSAFLLTHDYDSPTTSIAMCTYNYKFHLNLAMVVPFLCSLIKLNCLFELHYNYELHNNLKFNLC